MLVLGTWRLTRGMENFAALALSLIVTVTDKQVSWSLPVSKRDPIAHGEVRTHGCCCDRGAQFAYVCPYHFAKAYLKLLELTFGVDFQKPQRALPLFPTRSGHALSKDQLVQTIRRRLASAGIETTSLDGACNLRERFSEHVLRVTGAQFLARAGIDICLMQPFAR